MDPNTRALMMGAAGAGGAEKIYVEDVFQTWLYTGNGSTQTITNGIDLSGKGGMVWIKGRSQASSDNNVSDTQRGNNATIKTNTTAAQVVFSSSFGIQHLSTGFTVQGDNNSFDGRNNSGETYASWTFREAAKFFDVVTYTGDGSNRTVAHSLGSVPGAIIVKRTDTAADWQVYHRSIANTEYMVLNSTAAKATGTTRWNSTTPTSTVFSLGTDTTVNANGGTYIAYLFAHDASGFGDSGNESVIKCGSYTGNGSTTGPVVDLGWEPQWILVKNASGVTDWYLTDTQRGMPLSGDTALLRANTSASEPTSVGSWIVPTATGFRITTNNSSHNTDTHTYIYIAIRRGPMKTPTDATKVFKEVAQTSQGTVSTDFPVDMVIMGDRSSTWGYNWSVQDRLRGKTAVLFTSGTGAENTTSLSTFDSNTSFKDGWVTGGTSAIYETFRRAPGFFDVVAYTGTGSTSQSVTHNLTVKPQLIITKKRSASDSWYVYTDIIDGSLDFFYLNFTDPKGDTPGTAPTATTFNPYYTVDSGATHIAYLFASCPGVSKVGSYTGTGTTLSIDCGFTAGARFVLIKRTDSTGDWYVWDTARGIVSGNDPYLLLNSTAAEVTSTDYIDPLNAGFQISSTAPAAINANGGTFIYLAVA